LRAASARAKLSLISQDAGHLGQRVPSAPADQGGVPQRQGLLIEIERKVLLPDPVVGQADVVEDRHLPPLVLCRAAQVERGTQLAQ
jgi:hypothetical protein